MPDYVFMTIFPSAGHAGIFDCLMTRLSLITMDNGRVHCMVAVLQIFQPNPQRNKNKIGKCLLQNKLKSLQNTGTCYPGLRWICQVHLGFGLSASAQVPHKPALAWVACPGRLCFLNSWFSYMYCNIMCICIFSIKYQMHFQILTWRTRKQHRLKSRHYITMEQPTVPAKYITCDYNAESVCPMMMLVTLGVTESFD